MSSSLHKNTKSFLLFATCFLILASISLVSTSGQDCSCTYQPDRNGCVIRRGPTQAGFVCRCRITRLIFITACIGSQIGCNTGEDCPANCASKDCCMLAKGNCDGY
ncbi:hypothetical protein Fcan01_01045 [Folsomia candida]|uniref:Uncharacterized protein n=1 Tax=Folsomia candida TaxID=158441 RepID=A0A226F0G0_FOLCA|nr:hypothetical protein Fcan01_01045 [Folsomia candida]